MTVQTPLNLMLARELAGISCHDDTHDDTLLAAARRTAQNILTAADIRLNELDDDGWKAPDDVVDYTARLLFLTPPDDLAKLVAAIKDAQAIHVVRDGGQS